MIKVDPGAQQTDAFQESRNLLLSTEAHADAIPGLEILADDVRCTHAAAIAQIDQDQLFYLTSRGLDPARPSALIIEGFLESLVERLAAGPVRDASPRRSSAASPRSSSGDLAPQPRPRTLRSRAPRWRSRECSSTIETPTISTGTGRGPRVVSHVGDGQHGRVSQPFGTPQPFATESR